MAQSSFESIHTGFWKHVANTVISTVPPTRIYHIYYAIMSLTTAVISMLQVDRYELQTLRKKGVEILRAIVHLNICIKDSVDLRYDPPRLSTRPRTIFLLEYLRVISEAGKMITSTDIGSYPFYAPTIATEHMQIALSKMLQLVSTYCEISLRDLAILHQQQYDPDGFRTERNRLMGLLYLPVEYV